MSKEIKYYAEWGISIWQGHEKVGELHFDSEQEMMEKLRELEPKQKDEK